MAVWGGEVEMEVLCISSQPGKWFHPILSVVGSTSDLVVGPLFATSRVEIVKQRYLLGKLDGEVSQSDLLSSSLTGKEVPLEPAEVAEYPGDHFRPYRYGAVLL